MNIFNVIGTAFLIALALYETYQAIAGAWFAMTYDPRVGLNRATGRIGTNPNASRINQPAARIWYRAKVRYAARSLVFHQLHMFIHDHEPHFRTLPYAAVGMLGFGMFLAAGLPAMTAFGIGVCGGVTAFVSKQGRGLAVFSDGQSEADGDFKNLTLRLRLARRLNRF